MSRRPLPECILILQDVGKNMNELSSSGEECLRISKNCITQIMLRKLFSKSQDEFALITFGSEKTKNELASDNEYRGIDVKSQHFSTVTPEILEQVENLKNNPNGVGDWLDATVVAIQFISDENEMKPYSELKIVLFSNFHNAVNENQIDVIVRKLKEMKIDLTVIGPDVPANISNDELTSKTKQGEILISSMVDELQGTLCSFKDANTELQRLQRKAAKPTPWNSMLYISSKIKIPIRAFKKIAEPKAFKWKLGTIDDKNAAVEKEKAYMKFDDTNEIEVEVQREELIDAYLFGTTIVPFSDIDKDSMTYKSGPKGLYLVGCTARDSIPLNILMGEGSYIVLARKDDLVGNHMFQSLVQAMHENDIVGIARRVYTDNSAAYLGALFPCVTDDSRYLVYAQLPFAEDEHVYRFSSLDKTQIADDELKVVDDLIDAMDLDQLDSDGEMYDPTQTYDPHEQYTLKCFGYKYVHPNEDIPDELKSDIARELQPKPIVIENSEAVLREIKRKFPLEKVVKKIKGRFHKSSGADEFFNNQIGTTTLFQQSNNNSVSDVAISSSSFDEYQILQQSIENTIKKSSEEVDKFANELKSLREKCLINNPEIYNEWMPRVKDLIREHNLAKLWNIVSEENLGIISKSESSLSDMDEKAVNEFRKIDFTNDEEDSMYGSLDTESNNDNWLNDL